MKAIKRYGVCLLGIIFIFSSLGTVLAVEPTPLPTPVPTPEVIPDPLMEVVDVMAMQYLYALMRAWGIEVEYNGYKEFGNEISTLLEDWVLEFLDTLPSNYTINQWIAPWQANFDYWGNLQGNNSMLEDCQDFVDWLISKFSLTDNSNTSVTASGYFIGNMKCYKCPVVVYSKDGNVFVVGRENTSDSGDLYVIFDEGGTNWRLVFVTDTPNVNYYTAQVVNNSVNTQSTGNVDAHNSDYTIYWSGTPFAYPINQYNLENYVLVDLPSDYWLDTIFNQYNTITEIDDEVAILTYSIKTPDNDPSYSAGMSIKIVNNVPDYIEIDWDGVVTVSNLPAIVSTGTIPTPGDDLNPGLVNAWHPISTLIEMTTDSMGMLIGIVYEFPEEVLIPIFAVLGGIIIFGIVHAMKEH